MTRFETFRFPAAYAIRVQHLALGYLGDGIDDEAEIADEIDAIVLREAMFVDVSAADLSDAVRSIVYATAADFRRDVYGEPTDDEIYEQSICRCGHPDCGAC